MNQIPNIEEEFMKFIEPALDNGFDDGYRGADPDKAQKAYRDRYAWALDIRDFFKKQLHQQLQKVRQDWLRQEIVKLEGMKQEEPDKIDYDGTGLSQYGFNSALQTIIDRYHSELDQDNK